MSVCEGPRLGLSVEGKAEIKFQDQIVSDSGSGSDVCRFGSGFRATGFGWAKMRFHGGLSSERRIHCGLTYRFFMSIMEREIRMRQIIVMARA